MAKRKKVSKAPSKAKKKLYHPETYGIQFDSLTFLVFCVFVLVVAAWMVSKMMGIRLF